MGLGVVVVLVDVCVFVVEGVSVCGLFFLILSQ
jgi:hypothetical protein